MKMRYVILFFIPALLLSCSEPSDALRARGLAAEKELEELRDLPFGEFLEQSYRALIRTSPELVTELGLDESFAMSGTGLDCLDEAYLIEKEKLERGILGHLEEYDESGLEKEEQLSYEIYRYYLRDLAEGQQYRRHQYLLSYMLNSVNVATEQFFTEIIPVSDASGAEKYIARLKAVLTKMEEADRQIQLQEEEGIFLPSPLVGPALKSIRAISRQNPRSCSFYLTLKEKLGKLDMKDSLREKLMEEAEAACRDSVIPGYLLLEKRLSGQQSQAPVETGVGNLPGGEDYYAWTLKHHTNSDPGAREIHQRGLAELERIHGEMREYFRELGYDGEQSIENLYRRLEREEGSLSGEAIVEEHRRLIDEAIGWMEPFFGRFPSGKVEVKPDLFGGFYIPPSFDGSRPGIFYASTGSAGRFTLPTLTFHETYPGHHYQIGLAGSLKLPLFRRQVMFTGYTEGWALYSEYLMAETGYYEKDIPGRLGHLQAEAFRAARLVADTGLHLYGWDIEEATAFFSENTGFDRGFASNQIYRYLVWPGQATSYYTGFMEFRDILTEEKARLGNSFDYKAFHSSLTDHGPMPLTLLKKEIFHYGQN